MDSNLLEMINRRIDDLKHDNEKRFDSLDGKVDSVLKFKWQIMGGTAVVSIVITFIFQILQIVYK